MMATFIHDEYLIAAISRQKELFDKSNKHYRDSEVKERIWESISTELNADGMYTGLARYVLIHSVASL